MPGMLPNALDAAVATSCILGDAGLRAARRASTVGSFATALLDELDRPAPGTAPAARTHRL